MLVILARFAWEGQEGVCLKLSEIFIRSFVDGSF